MTRQARKRLFDVLRVAACVAALWIVIQGVTLQDHVTLNDGGPDLVGMVDEGADEVVVHLADGGQRTVRLDEVAVDDNGNPRISIGLRTAWSRSTKSLLLLALLIHFVVVFPQALRFHWLLRAQRIPVGYWECLKLSFAGNFLNFTTPLGSNLGDVFKAYFVSQHTRHKTEAVTTVALDRIVGLGSLLLVVALITGLSPSTSRLAEFRPYMLGMFGIGLVAVFAYLSPTLRRYCVPHAWLARLPKREYLRRIDNAARTLAGRKSIVVGAVLITIFLQALAIGAYFTVAMALRLRADAGNVLEYYTYFYTGILIQTLPGPPQGLGTVELAYRYFLAPFGSPSQIVCVAFAIRTIVLTCSLPGLLVTLTGAYKPREVAAMQQAGEASDPQPVLDTHDLGTT